VELVFDLAARRAAGAAAGPGGRRLEGAPTWRGRGGWRPASTVRQNRVGAKPRVFDLLQEALRLAATARAGIPPSRGSVERRLSRAKKQPGAIKAPALPSGGSLAVNSLRLDSLRPA